MKQYEQKYDFINKALLESVAQITEMTRLDHPTASARVKSADKMVMLPPLFDGSKPEVKQHYKGFNQYIKFQTKSGNIRDPVGKAIELFEHTLDKKALVWFQEHRNKFVDLTTLKTMFLQRYNPWGKTKQDELQSWNILIFDPQKMDVDELDLINTLGDMLGQTEESKMEKFIDTMLTIIQTHLITCKTWEKTTDKAKELEHIIRKCDPPAAALPNLTKGATILSLYSHIAHSDDREETDIPQPFKRAHPKQPRQKILWYRYKMTNIIMMILTIVITMKITEANLEDIDFTETKIQVDFPEVKIHVAEVNKIRIHTKANIKIMAIKAIITKAIEIYIITHAEIFSRVIIMANLEAEAMAKAEAITTAVVTAGPIIKVMLTTNTISIMVMMVSTRQINMVHHVHYVMTIITLLNIALRENMISMILWKK